MADVPHAWPPDLSADRVAELRRTIESLGLGISNINAFMMCAVGDFHHPSWIEADPSARRMRVEHTKASVELAARLGARTVSTEPGGPIPAGMPREQALRIFRDGLREAAALTEKKGVRILIEPEPELLLERSEQALEFLDSAGLPGVGLNFDLGHFHVVGEDVPSLIRRLGPRIEHVHLEDIRNRVHHHLPPGEGDLDFPAVFDAFRDIGYEGWITIELYPYQDDPVGIAARAYDAIRPLLR